ncbi:KTSC domain-containing protein [Paracoccus suum]|uniref:KTSC domain-containing protein n=1 Tax=Paracoccus suum TaxID=2259340 RepID=A0A344PH89_9RHOB|nr:KTSC domain-containing protein [Paracoccus suum]AXC48744.1 KTSC domain-containing protein [Paracoccus suum]
MPVLDSSAILQAEWADGRLVLWFPDGDRYAYRDVPEKVYHALLAAGSAGAFFSQHIRDAYPAQRIGRG